MTSILTVDAVKVHFGGVKAVDGVSLTLQRGALYGMVGPNGSGKTTLLNAICGHVRLTAGRIALGDRRISGRSADAIYRAGLARTFQGLRLLPDLSVRENVLTGLESTGRAHGRREVDAKVDQAIERLALPAFAKARVGGLPYGTQRRVEIARALAGQPDLLLLDEPVAGMNSTERDEIAAILATLKAEGLTMLLIEHDLRFVLRLSDHLVVMNFGTVLAQGEPRATADLPAVREAYLGRKRGVA
jgi:ABC-type branched-subunit amino acid transport system ATPase component